MHAAVRVQDGAGVIHELVHGDLIGRVWSATLQINDGRVSEAHAIVSLRGGELRLLGLRGAFALHGRPLSDVVLEAGQVLQLARGIELTVLEVRLPERVLGVEGPGLIQQALPGVCSIVADPAPRLTRGWRDDGLWSLWSTGDAWMARDAAGEVRQVEAGDTLRADDVTLRLVDIPLRAAGPAVTRRAGELDAPLTLIARFESVDVQRGDEVILRLSGKAARLVSELVAVRGPMPWGALSSELWPDEPEPLIRRSRLDVILTRIRRRLRDAGIRDDLVRSDRAGQVELLLHPHDAVVDQT